MLWAWEISGSWSCSAVHSHKVPILLAPRLVVGLGSWLELLKPVVGRPVNCKSYWEFHTHKQCVLTRATTPPSSPNLSSLSQLLLSTLFVLFLPSFTPLSLKIYRVHLVLPVGTEPRTIYWNRACNPEEILFFLPQWPSLSIASQLWMGLGEHLPYLCWDFWMAWSCTCSHSHCEFMRAIACHV